ncbi:hydroxyacylglutathione hydrolase, mitochondrial-like [Macrosteles quadrilineatus]|uniref:hydroxyacylglutathione hydrolase, mitochondrial-like n=1 Tax=Macrosteles quadrilineatus TaxID=74068 RepID=UPI0023E09E92|nr:hydroxyacylglutathione hydrolase, mitochondrial-like [Macrosteles quadrilineatus]XP_054289774.1 hydroxyacylglutathione hydrolase, mitochondrial-like [Macrosteles quadrilineatus]
MFLSVLFSILVYGVLAAYRREGEKFHSQPKTVNLRGAIIKVIPALHDNYMYLIIDEITKEAAVIDPVEPQWILEDLEGEDYRLTKILNTHYHKDHTGGNRKLLKDYPEIPVYGKDDRIDGLTTMVEDNERIHIGALDMDVIHTPCHTTGDVCYVLRTKPRVVFTGDTLTIAGCGRFLEGTADQMYKNLYFKLGVLPNDTLVFCGHEFTYPNLMYASHADPYNRDVGRKLNWSEVMLEKRLPTVPSTIGEEWQTNPFMRVDTPDVQWRSDSNDPVKTLEHIRREKDNHKVI